MDWFIPAEKYVDQWKPLPVDTGRGMGIFVFDNWWDTYAFIEANWELSLGPGWEPLGLNSGQLAYVLERAANEEDVKFVVLNAPALQWGAQGGPPEVQVQVANIREFVDVLRGSED
jgi:hypothetical protein